MEPIDAAVFEGRNPAWREWWEQRLDQQARARVESAVKNGTGVKDPSLEPFVYGLIARTRRRLRLRIANMVVLAVLTGLWVYSTADRVPWWHAFWIVMLLVDLTVVPRKLWQDARQLARAEQALGSSARE